MLTLTLSHVLEYLGINESERQELSEIAFEYSSHMRDKEGYENTRYTNKWEVYDDIANYIYSHVMDIEIKINLLFEMFEVFPTYGHSMLGLYNLVADGTISSQSEEFQKYFWNKMISYFLNENNAYRFSSNYLLGIELLESERTIPYTWDSIKKYGGSTFEINELLLINSSAVNMDIKIELYKALIGDTRYHNLIMKSMYYSSFGYYGQFSISQALPFFCQLTNIDVNSHDFGMIEWFMFTKESTLFHKGKQ